jgi:gamma-glutamyl-gamma-aminobutyrate hydrolase PuuD
MKTIKIYHVQKNANYSSWIQNRELVTDPKDADIIFFEGGEDVDPSLYGQKIGKHTSFNRIRDDHEKEIFEQFPTKLKWGTCRGVQFLSVMNGAKMIQHVTGHSCTHNIVDNKTGEYLTVPCGHHQMVYPFDLPVTEYEIIAQSLTPRSNTYLDGDNKEIEFVPVEPEIVYYLKTHSLGVQFHPEWCNDKVLHDYLNKLILQYL